MIRPRPAGRRPRRGETLVATAIIGLLFGLLLMGVQAARQSSRRLQCASNLRQLGQALAAYATAFGSFPYGNSSAAYSLHVSLLPYLDQQPLYDSIDRRGMAYNAHSNNATACATNVAGFLCPADFRPQDVPSGWTNYAGNVGSGVQRDGYKASRQIKLPNHTTGFTDE